MYSRRTFLELCSKLSLGALAFAGCSSGDADSAGESDEMNLGPARQFPVGRTVLDVYRLVVFRDQEGVGVMSLGCTHQLCLLQAQPDSYVCPCHGSIFDADGSRRSGPAPRGLPWYQCRLNAQGELLVTRAREVESRWRLKGALPS